MTTVKQIEEAERRSQEAEMSVVLAQPHRRGSRSQHRATALGRFVEDHRLRPEFIRAGDHYGTIKRKWRAAIEAPRQERINGSGVEVPVEVVERWKKQIDGMEGAMLREGPAALGCVEWLAVDDKDLAPGYLQDAIKGMMALAIELEIVEPERR